MERVRGESANDRNDRAIRTAAHWYAAHLAAEQNADVVLLTNDRENKKRALMEAADSRLQVFTGTAAVLILNEAKGSTEN